MRYILLLISLLVGLSGCGVTDAIDSVNETPGKMDSLKGSLDNTSEKLHKQTLEAAIESMLNEHNTGDPANPGKMTPGGDTFAKEATTEEIIKLTYVWLKDINGSGLTDLDVAEAGSMGENLARLRVNHNKSVHLTGLQVIAGLTSQEKVEQIIVEQVVNQGRYEETAYSFLVLRAAFTEGYLLSQGVLKSKIINYGMSKEAVERLEALDFLKKHPLQERFTLEISGFLPAKDREGDDIEDLNFKVTLNDVINDQQMMDMGQKIVADSDSNINKQALKPADQKKLEEHLIKANNIYTYYRNKLEQN